MTAARHPVRAPESGWLAVAWFAHRRTESVCRALGIPLEVLISRRRGVIRYLVLGIRTLFLLLKCRPRVLLVQNPSIGAAMVAVLLRPLFRYRLVIDAHNEAVTPYIHDAAVIRRIAAWLLRKADQTLVTNAALAEIVTAAGGSPFVLFDPIPVPPQVEPANLGPDPNVVVISTFAPDEPLPIVLEAASQLSEFTFYITGRLADENVRQAVERIGNVRLTGFLPENDYWALLRAASIVLDLTEMPNCLVCGAYEAIALAKPVVLTDDPAARQLFAAAAVYTSNRAESLVVALNEAQRRSLEIGRVSRERASELGTEWRRRAGALVARYGP